MSKIDGTINRIKEQQIGSSTKKVLLVEGSDDELAFGAFLRKKFPSWEQYWVIASTGKKQNVLDILAQEQDWLGIVDRDEWDNAKIEEKQEQLPNLFILPRFCIENYLVLPDEIWSALPENKKNSIENGCETLRKDIETQLENWRNHAAVWAIINPLWEGLRSLGFKESLLELNTSNDTVKIEQILQKWHQYLEPSQLLEKLKDKKQEINACTVDQQLKQYIHGKHFFKNVVYPVLISHIGNIKEKELKKQLFNSQPIPEDLDFLWQHMMTNTNTI
ncbi:DUF4435 domain-containing protein [Proteus mirabilis]|uniref:DUF4435 domain-containing protein n=1 Tax=Proteus mirabilis TaxID=584 RepID=UPI0039B54EEE